MLLAAPLQDELERSGILWAIAVLNKVLCNLALSRSMTYEKQLTQEEVIRMLAQIEQMVEGFPELPEATKEKSLRYLGAAKEEAQSDEPDKHLAAGNLKRMAETLKTTSETIASTKTLWENVKPVLQELPIWFGVAKSFFGF